MRSVVLLMAMSAGALAGGEPPTHGDCVECTLETDFLWPPNHNLVSVGLQVTGIADATITVYSDEDDVWPASAQFSPDAKLDCKDLRLRSERGGPGDGRVYLIVVQGDHECVLTVVVPHDLSAASIASVFDQADAARDFFIANGTPPPGFFLVGDGPIIGPKQ
jgi:hypothetical protein